MSEISNSKHVPAGREAGPDLTKPASDAVMAEYLSRPRDRRISPQSDRQPVYDVAPVLPQKAPAAVPARPLDVHLPRRTQANDPRATDGRS